jgi:hypothetical protein
MRLVRTNYGLSGNTNFQADVEERYTNISIQLMFKPRKNIHAELFRTTSLVNSR